MIPHDSCLWVLAHLYSPSHTAPGLAYGTKEDERSDGMPLLRLGDKSHCSYDIGHSLSVITSSEGNQLPCHEQSLERQPRYDIHTIRNWSLLPTTMWVRAFLEVGLVRGSDGSSSPWYFVTSQETLSQNHPAKQTLNSSPSEGVWVDKHLSLSFQVLG